MTHDNRLRALLVCLLLALYTLAYIPGPDSADGKAILAVSASLAERGRVDMDVVRVSDGLLPKLAQLGSIGVDGALYTKKGPTPSLFLALLLWLTDHAGLPTRAAAMFFNSLVTTLTAALLFTFVRRLGYRASTAFLLGLIFGAATLALPYTRTLYGEPLVGLLLLIAVMAAYAPSPTTDRRLIVCGAAVALCIGANLVYLLFVPIFAVYVLWQTRQVSFSARLRKVIAFVLPILICGVLLLLYNWARFGSPFESGYHFGEGEGFIHPLVVGMFALFFSPYRGFFWYSPVLWLALPGWVLLVRQSSKFGALAWLLLALIVGQAVGFGSWWSWHGGILWGTRFLLPAVPLAVLLLAPLIELSWVRRWLRIVISSFAVVSVGVALLGTLYSYFPYFNYLYANFASDSPQPLRTFASGLRDEVVFTPADSPILGHLAMALNGWPIDSAWAANDDSVHLGIAAGLAMLGFALYGFGKRIAPPLLTGLVIIACAVAIGVIAARQGQQTVNEPIRALQAALNPPGVVLATTALYDDALLDIRTGSRVISMNAPTRADDSETAATWAYVQRSAQEQGGYLWLVTWFGPTDESNWQERALWQSARFITERSVGRHRALLFKLNPAELNAPTNEDARFAVGLTLATIEAQRDENGVTVIMRWRADQAITQDYGLFVHVLDSGDQILAQQDRLLQGGYARSTLAAAGGEIVDRVYFPLSDPRAAVRVRIGLVNRDLGEPIKVSANNQPPQDFLVFSIP